MNIISIGFAVMLPYLCSPSIYLVEVKYSVFSHFLEFSSTHLQKFGAINYQTVFEVKYS